MGLQEKEQQLDTQIGDKRNQDDIEDKFSTKFGSSSKLLQQPTKKENSPKTKGTPSRAKTSTTLLKEEIPRMQLSSSTTKWRENKGNICYGIQKQTKDILESPLSQTNVEYTQVTPTKKKSKLPKMRGKMKQKQHNP